jgi:DNA repair exonuclease SbcCD ATPase subunit
MTSPAPLPDGLAPLSLPVPERLVLSNFSLYQNRRTIEVTFQDGVFCLVGANGLGKSTFLTTLHYAITGLAPDPDRKFMSLNEYYRHTSPYARTYYAGRVRGPDRDVASVRVAMRVGTRSYELERGFFEPESLRYLRISDDAGTVREHDEAESDASRNQAYKSHVVADSGLAHFEQLVFVQHFLVTFDERRRLLLWDEETIEQALLLAFGVSPETAQQADDWRRQVERLDSQARNQQYQATTALGRITDLRARTATEDVAVDETFEQLEREHEALTAQLARLTSDLGASAVAAAEAQALLVTAEQAYEEAFTRLLTPEARHHPVVVDSLQTDACGVCAQHGARVRLQARLDAGTCPLCGAETGAVGKDAPDDSLEVLDTRLAEARVAAAAALDRKAELSAARADVERQLAALDQERDTAAPVLPPGEVTGAAIEELIRQYEREAADAKQRRAEFRARRDDFRHRLAPVARELAQRYSDAEELFVPQFRALAHSFLGLDIDVYLQQRAGRPRLVVSVEGSERRSQDQLSESQRYFLDIALRMALVRHIAAGGHTGCLYIDTPEGSLDISYEARAGNMFADFVRGHNRLIMTANINTSRLLRALATACGPKRMKVVRMMEWARLSEVQAEGEELFEEALAELQQALSQAAPTA